MKLIKQADGALYKVKNLKKEARQLSINYDGPTWAIHDPEAEKQAENILKMENELNRALENKELVLHYQPILSLDRMKGSLGNSVIGFEGLVRWNHPEMGLLYPNTFVPTAEQSKRNLITKLADYTLEEAAKQAAAWGCNQDLFIAANVTLENIKSPMFEANLSALLRTYSVPYEAMALEITETTAVEIDLNLIGILGNLKDKGLRPELDDTFYGFNGIPTVISLAKVVSALKLDRLMVDDIYKNSDIIELIILIARNRNLQTIAEGVETKAQARLLGDYGCNSGQGWLWCKAVPPEEAWEWATTFSN